MNLDVKERIYIITKLSEKIHNMGLDHGILTLEEYTKQEKGKEDESFYNQDLLDDFHFSYHNILKFIQNLDNKIVYKMYKDLLSEDANKKNPKKEQLSYHLSTNKLVLFFSHSHKDLNLISKVKEILEKTDWIECFIAHKNIKLSKKWEQEIKKHLECCHCLIAFLSENFKSSDYCDQELGIAVHRNIPICPVILDNTKIYGFIKHLQAKPFKNPEDLANQIEEYIFDPQETLHQIARFKLQRTIETLKINFLNSTNTKMAESVLDQLMAFKTGQIKAHSISEIQENWKQNSKIKEVNDIERKMKKFFEKHLQQKASRNEKTSHHEVLLKQKEQLNTEINLSKAPEQNREPDIPF